MSRRPAPPGAPADVPLAYQAEGERVLGEVYRFWRSIRHASGATPTPALTRFLVLTLGNSFDMHGQALAENLTLRCTFPPAEDFGTVAERAQRHPDRPLLEPPRGRRSKSMSDEGPETISISIHEVVYLAFEAAPGRWFTNHEVSAMVQGVSPRTVRAKTLKLAELGLLDAAEVFPEYLAKDAPKRGKAYLTRLKHAAEAFGATR